RGQDCAGHLSDRNAYLLASRSLAPLTTSKVAVAEPRTDRTGGTVFEPGPFGSVVQVDGVISAPSELHEASPGGLLRTRDRARGKQVAGPEARAARKGGGAHLL